MEIDLSELEDLLDELETRLDGNEKLNGHSPRARFILCADGSGRVELVTPEGRHTLSRWGGNHPGGRAAALKRLSNRLETI